MKKYTTFILFFSILPLSTLAMKKKENTIRRIDITENQNTIGSMQDEEISVFNEIFQIPQHIKPEAYRKTLENLLKKYKCKISPRKNYTDNKLYEKALREALIRKLRETNNTNYYAYLSKLENLLNAKIIQQLDDPDEQEQLSEFFRKERIERTSEIPEFFQYEYPQIFLKSYTTHAQAKIAGLKSEIKALKEENARLKEQLSRETLFGQSEVTKLRKQLKSSNMWQKMRGWFN